MKIPIKKGDKILIGVLIVISFIPYYVISFLSHAPVEQVYAEVKVEGKLYQTIPLTGQIEEKLYIIHTPKGNNEIKVKDEKISVVKSDCKDHLCEEFGEKELPGEVIICLPHELSIELKGTKKTESKIDTRLY